MAKFTKGEQVIAIKTGKNYELDDVGEVTRVSGVTMKVRFGEDERTVPTSHFAPAPQMHEEVVQDEPEQEVVQNETEDQEVEQDQNETVTRDDAAPPLPPSFAQMVSVEGEGPGYRCLFGVPCPRLDIADMWAHYHAKALRTIVHVVDDEGRAVKTYDYTHLPAVQVAPDRSTERQHSRGRPPSPGSLDLKGPLAEGVKLAQRPEGVRRADLTKLLNGVQRDWKGMLTKEAKRLGFDFDIDKTGDTPVYRLISRAA